MKGVHQHRAEKHLHRYLSEYDFRYSNHVAVGVDDQDRAAKALQGIVGKRLTYGSSLINSRPACKDKPWRHRDSRPEEGTNQPRRIVGHSRSSRHFQMRSTS